MKHSVSIDSTSRSRRRLAAQATSILLSRTAINTARRFAYPFAPALSRWLGVPLSSITAAIGLNQSTGLLGIVFGPISDRLGYRFMMLIALSMLSIGMFAAGILPLYVIIVIGLFLTGLSKNIFDAALQAYVGEQVPFAKRGTVIGLLELAWSGSTLIGIPVMGFVIEHAGWQTAFLSMGSCGLIGLLALAWLVPADRHPRRTEQSAQMRACWKLLFHSRTALTALCFAFLVSMANDLLFVVYGAWLETAFNLSLVALGVSTAVIGVAELSGELLTAAWADRLGLRRMVLLSTLLAAICYGLLPALSGLLPLALLGLFAIFIAFECTFVSFMSVCTEVLPEARATMMSGVFASAGLGRFAGAWCGGLLWDLGGIRIISLSAVLLTALAWAVYAYGMRRWNP